MPTSTPQSLMETSYPVGTGAVGWNDLEVYLPWDDKSSLESPSSTYATPAVVLDFMMGREGLPPPSVDAISTASRIVRAAQAYVENADIVWDDEDGELIFHFLLPDGGLLMAEFTWEGNLWAGVYGNGRKNDVGQSMPTTEEQFLALFNR